MAWVKMDDGYTDHPKVEAAGPLAAWLNVCGWAYSARYLTDGFIPSGRVSRLAAVDDAPALARKLVEVGLWQRVEGGYLIHDYLTYNPSAEQVRIDREAAKERMQAVRKRGRPTTPNRAVNRSPEVRANDERSSSTENSARSSSSPYPVPVTAPNGAAQHPPTVQKPILKPNRSAEVIDAIRKRGVEPTLSERDHAALKHTSAKAELIAEVYGAVYSGNYGDEFMQRHLCVREAIGWIDGYLALKNNGPPRTGRNGTGTHHVSIDNTGRAN